MSPETIQELTRRPVNPGAEKWLGKEIPVLDHGFVYLLDYMGGDAEIARAARTSYGPGTRTIRDDEMLIQHLLSHSHTSPFEMVEFKFHAKMPIFVARQWVRHRTANLNEMSGRYSILDNEFYIPTTEEMGIQSKINKQGRVNVFDKEQAEYIRQLLINDAEHAHADYQYMLNDNGKGDPQDPSRDMLARELARMNLSLNFYTQWYWKIDLHNLLHFFSLRMDAHAQREIQAYANAMGTIVKDAVPNTWKAFENYKLNAKTFSQSELQLVGSLLSEKEISLDKGKFEELLDKYGLTTKWEKEELAEKLQQLGIKING